MRNEKALRVVGPRSRSNRLSKRGELQARQKRATEILRNVENILRKYDRGLKPVSPSPVPGWTIQRQDSCSR